MSPRCSQNMRMAQREETAALVETPARPMLCHLGQGFGTHRQDEDNQFRVISKCNIERARVPPSTLTGTHQATACITAAGTRGPVPPTTRTNGGSRFVLELGTQTPTHATTHARKQTHTHTQDQHLVSTSWQLNLILSRDAIAAGPSHLAFFSFRTSLFRRLPFFLGV